MEDMEDGALPDITSTSSIYDTNVMLIRVSDELRKPDESIYQLATFDHSKEGIDWLANKYLDMLIPVPPKANIWNEDDETEPSSNKQCEISHRRPRRRRFHSDKRRTQIQMETVNNIDPWLLKPWETQSFYPGPALRQDFSIPVNNMSSDFSPFPNKGLLGDGPVHRWSSACMPENGFIENSHARNYPGFSDEGYTERNYNCSYGSMVRDDHQPIEFFDRNSRHGGHQSIHDDRNQHFQRNNLPTSNPFEDKLARGQRNEISNHTSYQTSYSMNNTTPWNTKPADFEHPEAPRANAMSRSNLGKSQIWFSNKIQNVNGNRGRCGKDWGNYRHSRGATRHPRGVPRHRRGAARHPRGAARHPRGADRHQRR